MNETQPEVPKTLEVATAAASNDAVEDSEDQPKKGGCCGYIERYNLTSNLIAVILGISIGVGLSYWNPEASGKKDVLIQWLGLPGDMFIRALKCFVLPLVFVNIMIAVVDMMKMGKASSIGWTIIALYLITTVAAAFFGTMSTLIFMRFYSTESDAILDEVDETSVQEMGISDVIYEGIFEKLVPKNIVDAFAKSNFTAVLFFAGVFGAALTPELQRPGNVLLRVLKDIEKVLFRIIRWIIFLTPFAVVSMITKGIGKQSDLGPMFSNIGLLMAASFVAWGLQVIVVYIGLFALLTKSNPFTYFKHIAPAQLFAFSSASSAATIPVSLKAVRASGTVPDLIGRLVVPFGATVNMDGGAVYFVCACIWLGVLNGEKITFASFLMLIIIATIGSIGTAPVPSASLVLIMAAYNTVFDGTGEPNGFGYIFAIDWFMDRIRTTCNVTGDCIVSGIVAHRCPVDEDTTDGSKGEKALSSASEDEESV